MLEKFQDWIEGKLLLPKREAVKDHTAQPISQLHYRLPNSRFLSFPWAKNFQLYQHVGECLYAISMTGKLEPSMMMQMAHLHNSSHTPLHPPHFMVKRTTMRIPMCSSTIPAKLGIPMSSSTYLKLLSSVATTKWLLVKGPVTDILAT